MFVFWGSRMSESSGKKKGVLLYVLAATALANVHFLRGSSEVSLHVPRCSRLTQVDEVLLNEGQGWYLEIQPLRTVVKLHLLQA